jgi:hypothetical protein
MRLNQKEKISLKKKIFDLNGKYLTLLEDIGQIYSMWDKYFPIQINDFFSFILISKIFCIIAGTVSRRQNVEASRYLSLKVMP